MRAVAFHFSEVSLKTQPKIHKPVYKLRLKIRKPYDDILLNETQCLMYHTHKYSMSNSMFHFTLNTKLFFISE